MLKRIINGKSVEGTQQEWDDFDKALKERAGKTSEGPNYIVCSGMSPVLDGKYIQHLYITPIGCSG